MRWLVLLLVTVAFAGCTDAPGADTDSTNDVGAPFGSGELHCTDVETCEVVSNSADGDTGRVYTCDDPEIECTIVWTEAVIETPVDWTGHTKEGVWLLCGGPGVSNPLPLPIPSGCIGQQIQPDGEFQTVQQYQWNLTGVELTLEWTAADATQTGLALNIQDNTGGGSLGTWEGSSTFTVDTELSVPYDPDTLDYELLFQVWPVAKDGGSNYIDVTQQEFTLTGVIRSTHPVVETVTVEWVGPSE